MTNGEEIDRRVLLWAGVTAHEHEFGGTEYRLGKREIGHYHADLDLVDIPLTRKVRDEVVAAGLAEPHHIFPDSGWISRWLREPEDLAVAIQLLERSLALARAQAERKAGRRVGG